MKRKKWSEMEEQTLLNKYSELRNSGALAKLKTREKKFKPVADHVNTVHHLQDPTNFPFKWTWRDVSIKVQNMRHQYLGVKQKIQVSKDDFNWKDGENHWVNFLKYKEVFGDVELDAKGKRLCENMDVFGDCGDLGFGIDCEDLEEKEEDDDDDDEEEEEEYDDCGGGGGGDGEDGNGCSGDGEQIVRTDGQFLDGGGNGGMGFARMKKSKKGFGINRRLRLMGTKVSELRDVVVKREERKRERQFQMEKSEIEREQNRKEARLRAVARRYETKEWLENRELELEERELIWARREFERRRRLERDFVDERRTKLRMEQEREEEEMEWRERMVGLQIEHEKQMMQIHAEACQNQMQIIGVMARLVCQFFGSASDGLGGALGALPPQVLQSLQHPGGLSDNGKPDANSPSEFL
ncbi:hypothetical protein I3760_03G060900 [Carya illinoinensis]|nr:hypothetical protein I3760_03G060900 [Carya illinoinensis]